MTGERSNSRRKGEGVSELPSCLIPYILVKLPIKSIVIFKCVCKSWNQLLLDPYFANLYSKNSQFTAMLLLQYPIVPISLDRDFRFLEIGTSSNDVVIHTPPFNLDTIITTNPEIAQGEHLVKRLVGSVNGLVCVVLAPYMVDDRRYGMFRYNGELFFVINPLTGEFVKLPQVKGGEEICIGDHGFGSTVDGDYYKIVIFRLVEIHAESLNYRWDFKILTVGVDDEWRDFDRPAAILDSDYFVSNAGVALNGALHWVVADEESNIKSIYAFDVGKEVGCRIPCPSNDSRSADIGVWGGRICFVQGSQNEFDVWTMRQYGVADSWTKDVILWNSALSHPHFCPAAIPKTTRRNADLLLSIVSCEGHKSLISFDPNTKSCVKLDEVYVDENTAFDLLEFAPCFSSLSRIISRQITIRDSGNLVLAQTRC